MSVKIFLFDLETEKYIDLETAPDMKTAIEKVSTTHLALWWQINVFETDYGYSLTLYPPDDPIDGRYHQDCFTFEDAWIAWISNHDGDIQGEVTDDEDHHEFISELIHS